MTGYCYFKDYLGNLFLFHTPLKHPKEVIFNGISFMFMDVAKRRKRGVRRILTSSNEHKPILFLPPLSSSLRAGKSHFYDLL